jgi:hypothetical protein
VALVRRFADERVREQSLRKLPQDSRTLERDLALQKAFQLTEGTTITFGAEAYNLFNHPNFGVPSNTQSLLTLGGNGDAIFKVATGNFATNVGRKYLPPLARAVNFNSTHGSLSKYQRNRSSVSPNARRPIPMFRGKLLCLDGVPIVDVPEIVP